MFRSNVSSSSMTSSEAATFLADLIVAHTCDIPLNTMGQIAMRTAKANELAHALSTLSKLTGVDLDRLARSIPTSSVKEMAPEEYEQLGLL